MATGSYEPYHAIGWSGLVRQDWTDRLADADPLQWLLACPHTTRRNHHAARVWRVESDGGVLWVKHMTQLKNRAAAQQGLLNLLKWRMGSSRVMRTLRVSRQLEACGLGAPPVVLAARRRSPEAVEELLVSEEVQGEDLRSALLKAPSRASKHELLGRAARAVAKLHDHRFLHGDLLPDHVMLCPNGGEAVFLDNDRTRRWPLVLPAWAAHRNLWQITCRIMNLHPWCDVRPFLTGYFEARGITGARRRKRFYRVVQRARRRYRERHPTRTHSRAWRPAEVAP